MPISYDGKELEVGDLVNLPCIIMGIDGNTISLRSLHASPNLYDPISYKVSANVLMLGKKKKDK